MTADHYIILFVAVLSICWAIISLIDMLERKKRLRAKKETWGKLSRISDSGNVGSAYLYSGPKGSGKEGLALKFAQLLNCQVSNIEICFKCESCIRFSTLQHERLNIIVPLPTPKDNKNFIPQDYINSIKEKSSDPLRSKNSLTNSNVCS